MFKLLYPSNRRALEIRWNGCKASFAYNKFGFFFLNFIYISFENAIKNYRSDNKVEWIELAFHY